MDCEGQKFCSRGFEKNVQLVEDLKGKHIAAQVTPTLAPLRLNDSRPFVTNGIDNVGSAYVKNVFGQSDKTYKA